MSDLTGVNPRLSTRSVNTHVHQTDTGVSVQTYTDNDQVNRALPDIGGLSRADAARTYMAAGIAIFPVDGKMPTKVMNGRMKWADESTTDLEQHAQWCKAIWFHGADELTHRRGMAIDCGKSNAVVVDVDRPALVPEAWWPLLGGAPFVSTDSEDPRRGHYFFAQPAEPVGCPKGEWGEVKGVGGYVVLPPSPHAAAHHDWPDNQTPEKKFRPTARYQQVRTGPLPVLPPLIADSFGAHRAAKASASLEDVAKFMEAHSGSREGSDPSLVTNIVKRFLNDVEKQKGRHPSMCSALVWTTKASGGGLIPADLARDTLESVFAQVKPEAYDTEFEDMWSWAVGQATPDEVADFLARRAQKTADYLASRQPAVTEEEWASEMLTEPQAVVPPQRSDTEDTKPRIVGVRASQVRMRKTEWMWDTTKEGATPTSGGRIPKAMLTMAAGLPGTGKSQYAIWLTAQITNGTLPGCHYGEPKNVIYAATEDDWARTIAPRLVAAGADMDKVIWVKVRTIEHKTVRLVVPEHAAALGEYSREEDVALVVLDPLLSHIGVPKLNSNAEKDIRDALEPLVAAAAKYGFTVLGLSHFNKDSKNVDPMERLMGSRGFSALLRALIVFAKDKDADPLEDGSQPYVLSQAKNNLGRTDLPSFTYTIQSATVDTEEGPTYVSRFVLGPETDNSVEQVLQDAAGGGGDRTERKEAEQWLHDYLTDPMNGGEGLPKDIEKAAGAAGIVPAALKQAKGKLGVKSVKSGGPGAPWVWRLPA